MADKQFKECEVDETKDLIIVCTQCGKEVYRKDGVSVQEYEETDTLDFLCPNDPGHILRKKDGKEGGNL